MILHNAPRSRASNRAGITASFGIHDQEFINVICENYPIASFGVVLGHLILLELMDPEYPVSFLHGRPNLINYLGTCEGSILILSTLTFCTGV